MNGMDTLNNGEQVAQRAFGGVCSLEHPVIVMLIRGIPLPVPSLPMFVRLSRTRGCRGTLVSTNDVHGITSYE